MTLDRLLNVLLLAAACNSRSDPVITTVLGNLQEDVNLTCDISDGQKRVQWTRERSAVFPDRKLIRNDHKYTLYQCRGCVKNAFTVMQINSVTESDDELYGCFTNSTSQKIKLKVIVPISGMTLSASDSVPAETITAIADQPLAVNCSVTKSRPVPFLSVHLERNGRHSLRTRFIAAPEYYRKIPHADGSFSTQVQFRTEAVSRKDDMHDIVCDAHLAGVEKELYFVQEKKKFRVLYAPECAVDREPVLVAVNRTNSIKCPIASANPQPVRYKWHTGSLIALDGSQTAQVLRIRPEFTDHIRDVECEVDNLIGERPPRCLVRLALGGKPDPISDCQWTYESNTTLQIRCRLGFHQGDRNQQCVLYHLDFESNVMREYSRSQRCSFTIEPTSYDQKHRLKVFSINKYGDSLQEAFEININTELDQFGQQQEHRRRMQIGAVSFIGFVVVLSFLYCCYYNCDCHRHRTGYSSEDSLKHTANVDPEMIDSRKVKPSFCAPGGYYDSGYHLTRAEEGNTSDSVLKPLIVASSDSSTSSANSCVEQKTAFGSSSDNSTTGLIAASVPMHSPPYLNPRHVSSSAEGFSEGSRSHVKAITNVFNSYDRDNDCGSNRSHARSPYMTPKSSHRDQQLSSMHKVKQSYVRPSLCRGNVTQC